MRFIGSVSPDGKPLREYMQVCINRGGIIDNDVLKNNVTLRLGDIDDKELVAFAGNIWRHPPASDMWKNGDSWPGESDKVVRFEASTGGLDQVRNFTLANNGWVSVEVLYK